MRSGLQRQFALILCDLAPHVLPRRQQFWTHAIRAEVAVIDDDREALLFAISSLIGVTSNSVSGLFDRVFSSEAVSSERSLIMKIFKRNAASLSAAGILCAIGATMLGIGYMVMGGAPIGYLAINFGALIIGLLMLAIIGKAARTFDRWSGPVMAAIGLCLLATALVGLELDGVSRWVKIGPLVVQPGLALVPLIIVCFVRSHGPFATLGMVATAVALAIQPDRAMAAAFAAGTLALLASRRDFRTVAIALSGLASFLVTMITPDPMPAMAYVDQIIFRSFDINLWAGSAVVGGLALLVLPAIFGIRLGAEMRSTSLVFASIWLTMIVAAALGNYPTPVVGYSGGAVLGYVLSLAMFSIIERSPIQNDHISRKPITHSSQPKLTQQLATA